MTTYDGEQKARVIKLISGPYKYKHHWNKPPQRRYVA